MTEARLSKRPTLTKKEALELVMRERKIAYSQVFGGEGPSAALVLKDLEKFCRARHSEFHPDQRLHALLSGRREVILRIRDYLELSLEDLCLKYGEGKENV